MTDATTGGSSRSLDFGYGGPGDLPVLRRLERARPGPPGVRAAQARLPGTGPGQLPGQAFRRRHVRLRQLHRRAPDRRLERDGRDTPGVKRGTIWYLVNTPGHQWPTSFGYGDPGDVGLVGDWDASADTVGIKRGAWWYLVNTAGKPYARHVASYGDPRTCP